MTFLDEIDRNEKPLKQGPDKVHAVPTLAR